MIYNLLLITLITITGIITYYEDHNNNKIKNKTIIIFIILGFIIHLINSYINNSFYKINFILINTIISFSVGFILWYFEFWCAGDAKLFTLYSLLIPLTFYKYSAIKYFPSYIILFNVFIPLSIILLIKSIKKFKNIKHKFLKDLKPTKIILEFVSISALYFIIKPIPYVLIKYLLLYGIIFISKKYIPKMFYILTSIILIIEIIFLETGKNNLGLILFLTFLSYIIKIILISISNHSFSKKIPVSNLKIGMIPTKNENQKHYFGSPINEEQIKYLTKHKKFIYVDEKISLSEYMFIGVLITLICKGNFIMCIFQFLK